MEQSAQNPWDSRRGERDANIIKCQGAIEATDAILEFSYEDYLSLKEEPDDN